MAELPTGTVTFLFTDLEDSTRLWERYPEAMKTALARHDEIVRNAIEAGGGQVVKTTGDGFHAAFAVGHDAAMAAIRAQRDLLAEPWGDVGRLLVRMGMHTGQAQHRDGDYFGMAVNRAARIMSVAHGDQILTSMATAELLRDELGDDVELVDLGEHQLRDLGRVERVFQLVHRELRREFPPVRSLDRQSTNLPVPATSFVGREREVADVAKALDGARLVTLTGVGGVGKTRLAMRVAGEALLGYRDGAWLCELAAIGDADAVADLVAASLQVPPRSAQSIVETVVDFLRSKQLLLVLDNCEHVLGTVADLVDTILRACPTVCVLATSREGLGLGGERILAVPSLALPERGASVESMAEKDAVRLFVERAGDAHAGFALTQDNADAIGELCRRLDGIPLAIELAAARTRTLAPADLVERLGQRFRVLTGGSRTARERQQTLRGTIDWSYDLLGVDERRVFNRLSVFAGGFILDGAEAVASDDEIDALDVLDLLASLVDKSLVVADHDDDGAIRYRLLETIRQYALEHLDETGESDAARRRHAVHYAKFAEEAGPHLRGGDQLAWLPRVDRETDNFRAAVTWAAEAGDADLALRLVVPLSVPALEIGYASFPWADLAATVPGAAEHPLAPRVLAWSAWHAVYRGDFDAAAARIRKMWTIQADLHLEPHPSVFLAPTTLAIFRGDGAEAATHARDWTETARACGDRYELAQALTALAPALAIAGDNQAAIVTAEEAVAVGRSIHNLGYSLVTLAAQLLDADPDRARTVLEEAAVDCLAVGNRQGYAAVLGMTAHLEQTQGNLLAALGAYSDALDAHFRLGDDYFTRLMLLGIADILTSLTHYNRGALLLGASGVLPLVPSGIEARQQFTEVLLAQLGPQRFNELHAEGEAMETNEAVSLAHTQIDHILAETATPTD